MPTVKDPIDLIVPLYMNGLQGRMLRMPAPRGRKREILFVYGHHSSLERWSGLLTVLNRYGAVTAPDLPGFGGMESFYKIGEKPTIERLADYLASFIKLRYRRKKFTIVGLSLGFAIATRMLQKYPELSSRVDLLISVVGFVHHEEFKFKRRNYLLMRYGSSFFSNRLPAWVCQHILMRPIFIRTIYRLQSDTNAKLKDADTAERDKRIDFEVGLWRNNDVRTYMETGLSMLTLDLCNAQVDLPVTHIAVSTDRYFDNHIVEQHLGVVFRKSTIVPARMPAHAPTVIADAKAAASIIPPKVRRMLAAR